MPSISRVGLVLLLVAATVTTSFSQVVSPSLIASIYDGAGPEPRLYKPNSVFVQGKYAYIIGGSNALEIVDISLPGQPVHMGSIIDGTNERELRGPTCIFVSGNYAYIGTKGDQGDGIAVIDVSNPRAPVKKSWIFTYGTYGIFVSGTYLYAVGSGLGIYDISNPTQLNQLSGFDVCTVSPGPNNPVCGPFDRPQSKSVFVSGSYAYITITTSPGWTPAFTANSLSIIDISNPFAPILKSNLHDGGGVAPFLNDPQAVRVVGNYAYIASKGSNRLEIVNVTNPLSPIHAGSLANGSGGALLSSPQSLTINGTRAYVASYGSNAIEIVNISTPASPTHAGSIVDGFGGALLKKPSDIFISGNYAFTASAGSNALEILDLANPTSIVHKGSLVNNNAAILTSPQSIFVLGNYVYVSTTSGNTLEILDITNPYVPQHKSSVTYGAGGANNTLGSYPSTTPGHNPDGLFVSGNFAYMLNNQLNRLEIIDVTNPALPVVKSGLANGALGALLSSPWSICVSGNYAYIASKGNNALEIVNITNPVSPAHAGSLVNGGSTLLSAPQSVAVSGNYAYVASTGSNALEIINVTNPASPTHLASLGLPAGFSPNNVKVSGKYAYILGDGNNGQFQTVDISNPAAPVFVGPVVPAAYVAKAMSVKNNLLGAVSWWDTSTILADVNVSPPQVLTNVINGESAIFLTDNFAYTVHEQQGVLHVYSLFGPKITDFNPKTGTSTVDITGANFNSLLTVSFNGTPANIVNFTLPDASGNQTVTVSVPSAATIGKISVNNNGVTATSSANFLVIPTASNATLIGQTSFTANWSNVGATNYYLDVSTDNFGTFVFSNYVGSVTSKLVTALPGTTYQYRVRSYDGVGLSGASLTIAPILTIPATPALTTTTAISQSGFTANWLTVSNAANYFLDVSTDAGFATFVPGYNNLSVSSTSQVVSGLNSGTCYYRVRSANASGSSPSSGVQSVPTVPVIPTTSPVPINSIGINSFTANWIVSTGATGYYLDVSADNFNTLVVSNQNITSGSTISYNVTGLSSGTAYQYRVRAYNASGTSGNSIYAPVTTKTATPTSTAATAVTPASFTATWTSVTGAVTYDLDWAVDNLFSSVTTLTGINTTSRIILGLNPQVTYYYRVRANNLGGASANSSTTIVTTLAAQPATQSSAILFNNVSSTSLTASFTAGSGLSRLVVVSASAPLNTTPVNQTSYPANSVYASAGTSIGNGYVVSAGASSSVSITGLSPSTNYYFQVFDFNGSGATPGTQNYITTTASNNPVGQNTIATVPGASPTNLTFSNQTQGSVTVSYTAAIGSSGGYLLLRAIGTNPSVPPSNGTVYATGASIGNATVASAGSSLSFFDGGLLAGTAYNYTVYSYNGTGSTINYKTTTPLQGSFVTVPADPTTSSASGISASALTANWNTRPGATGYYLDVSIDNFATFVSKDQVVSSISFGLTGLLSGASYQYRVRAYNASGTSGYSNTTSVLTFPAAPAVVAATSVTPTSFSANWIKVTGATGYFLDVADNVSFNNPIKQNTPVGNTSSSDVTGLMPEATYYYRVHASNISGASIVSDPVSVKTLANPVSPQSYALYFSNVSSTSMTLNFTAGSSGASHLVVASEGSPLITALPVNQTSYTANSVYRLGDPIGNGYAVSIGNSPVTITGLDLSTIYYFQVFDFSGSGGTENYLTSTASNNPASQSTLATNSASQPTNLTFSNITATGATVSFTAAAGNPTGYVVIRSSNATLPSPPSNGTTYATGSPFGSTLIAYAGSSLSFNEVTLSAGTTYYYSVYSYNGSGSTINYLITNPLRGSLLSLPSDPAASAASATGASGFTANWSAATGASDYFLDVSTDNFSTFVSGYNNLPIGSTVSYSAIGLASGSSYQYRVRAHNVSGTSGSSNSISVLTLPDAPPGLTTANITQNAFKASWMKVFGANAYYLDVAADSLFSTITYGNISIGNASSYVVSGLSSSSTYYFRLRAGNQTGVSANSDFLSLTTLAAPVTTQSSALTFSNVTSTTITVNYTPGSGTSHLMVVSAGAPLTSVPSNRINYTANTSYSQGSQIGNGYVVNSGLSPIVITNLSAAIIYYVQVFDFNGSGGTENYNIIAAANNPASQTTLSTTPAAQPTGLTFSNQSATSVNASFAPAAGSPTGYLVLRASGVTPSDAPTQGNTYAIGTSLGNAKVAHTGSSVSFFDGGLPTSIKYYYSVYAYNGNGTAINYRTTSPLQGNVTLDVIAPVISAPSTANSPTITKLNTTTLSSTITDNVGVASAQIFYKGISQKDFKSTALSAGASNNYSATVQTDWYDDLGLEYYFMATDGNGNTTTKSVSNFAQLITPSISLPTLPTGTTESSYRIVSFPYVLSTDNKVTTVYNGAPWDDNTKAAFLWWDPTQKGGAGDYLRYGTQSGIQTVDPGKGYWIMTSTAVTPSLNNILAPKYNRSNLYSMTLKPKWNEIGNPYPVAVSWDDVIAYNEVVNPGALFSKLNVYDGTGYKEATDKNLLKPFEGGFVKNLSSSDITIQIPFPDQTSGGRTSIIGTDISQDAWNISLHIQQEGFTNELGGFGMHPKATFAQDRYDNFNPPRLMEMPEVNFTNSEFPSVNFSNNMVKSQQEYTWQFTTAGILDKPIQLDWDLPTISGSSQQLFLLDEEHLKLIDMTRENQYNFTLGSKSRFRIFYGRNIERKITTLDVVVGDPYPNPLTRESRTTINVALPDQSNEYQVNVQFFNGQGVLIQSINKTLAPGIHPLEFTFDNQYITSDMYYYRMSVDSGKSSKIFTGKIVKP